MKMLAGAVVDGGALAEVIAVSFVAGVTVTAAYATAILSLTRLGESRRDRRTLVATAYTWLAGIALAVSVGAVVLGIFVMATN
jgi:hypothetical protein